MEDIPYDVCTWIVGRALSAYHRGGSYRTRYENILASENSYKYNLEHLDEYVIKELSDLKKSKQGTFERKTEISYKEYKFSKLTDSEVIEDTSYCVYTLYKNGFLTKTRDVIDDKDVLCSIPAQANSILIGFDQADIRRIKSQEARARGEKILTEEFAVEDNDEGMA